MAESTATWKIELRILSLGSTRSYSAPRHLSMLRRNSCNVERTAIARLLVKRGHVERERLLGKGVHQ